MSSAALQLAQSIEDEELRDLVAFHLDGAGKIIEALQLGQSLNSELRASTLTSIAEWMLHK